MKLISTKISQHVKLKAAKVVSDYCMDLWIRNNRDVAMPIESENGCKCFADILEPFIGPMPPLSDVRRTYWISVKYEITRLAYEEYLKCQQLWIQSIPYYGIHVRKKIPIKEGKRFMANIRRMVNHALEIDEDVKLSPFMSIGERDQLRINRDLQLNIFLNIKDQIEMNSALVLDDETKDLYVKLKYKVSKYLT